MTKVLLYNEKWEALSYVDVSFIIYFVQTKDPLGRIVNVLMFTTRTLNIKIV